ncbi:MAG: DNA polymerase III subunit alpha [candidate division BRC1 bacterium ADurb.BinA364]|nr:MAG: DNA polymerase III subunit alpha [candidate division BRC1 bacterium ADurb.BinA364]
MKRVAGIGQKAVALTDHGVMFGLFDFCKYAKDAGIQPILGSEMYLADGSRFDKESPRSKRRFHLLLLAESTEGYHTLAKLNSMAFEEGFYYKPRVDLDLLAQHHEGLICLTACLAGPVAQHLLDGDDTAARQYADDLAHIFGKDRLFLEIMDHGMPEQKQANAGIVRIARETGLPLVATNDAHFLTRDDFDMHKVLLCLSTNKTLDEKDDYNAYNAEMHIKTSEEMAAAFRELPEAILNTRAIAERCQAKILADRQLYPKYVPESGQSDVEYLRELAEKGLRERFPAGLPDETEYRERLNYELGVIERMGFCSYYLVVWDFIKYAKDNGIPVGPGRGSGAASLVAYSLRITDLDPIKNSLVFERFLTPERVSPPDFDIDFCFERRGKVIEYVKKKYGDKNVAQIVTFGTLKAKNAVRDVARAMGMTPAEGDRIAKMIPGDLGITIDQSLERVADLKKEYETDDRIRQLIDYARRLEGFTRHSSLHAAGVIIADEPLWNLAPTFRPGGKGEPATQYTMKQVEALGLLKMDFLGLKNLTIIDRCERTIRQTRGVKIDWDAIPDNDEETYRMLQRGEAFGVFQLESSGMRELLRNWRPETFPELSMLIALYRPGPMNSIRDFIERKHGRLPIQYPHEMLEPILKETYGMIVYQEQVQQIAHAMAGFSLGQADLLRRAMGKKIPEEMQKQAAVFVEGAVRRGVDRQVASGIFDLMAKFAEYGFNKAHSAAYAVVSFRTAYLKAHYPVEYMAALLTNEIGSNNDKLGLYIGKAKEMGIETLPPSVNESNAQFTPVGKTIRFGLAAIKNVGQGVVDSIVAEREARGPFKSLLDFCERVGDQGRRVRLLRRPAFAAGRRRRPVHGVGQPHPEGARGGAGVALRHAGRGRKRDDDGHRIARHRRMAGQGETAIRKGIARRLRQRPSAGALPARHSQFRRRHVAFAASRAGSKGNDHDRSRHQNPDQGRPQGFDDGVCRVRRSGRFVRGVVFRPRLRRGAGETPGRQCSLDQGQGQQVFARRRKRGRRGPAGAQVAGGRSASGRGFPREANEFRRFRAGGGRTRHGDLVEYQAPGSETQRPLPGAAAPDSVRSGRRGRGGGQFALQNRSGGGVSQGNRSRRIGKSIDLFLQLALVFARGSGP